MYRFRLRGGERSSLALSLIMLALLPLFGAIFEMRFSSIIKGNEKELAAFRARQETKEEKAELLREAEELARENGYRPGAPGWEKAVDRALQEMTDTGTEEIGDEDEQSDNEEGENDE